MLQALADAGVEPDLIVGASVGALNGAIVAARPLGRAVERLEAAWTSDTFARIYSEGVVERATNLVRHGTHLHSNEPIREVIDRWAPASTIEDLSVRFQCVAAQIETSREIWFDQGPLADRVLASAAVPGLFPPVRIDDRHYLDGGVVNSIPISRAVELGATEIYVLHVGNIDVPLEVPTRAWDVAMVAFEVSRRHRFDRDLRSVPPGVTVRVLPTGAMRPARFNDPRRLLYRASESIPDAIARAREATSEYLAGSFSS